MKAIFSALILFFGMTPIAFASYSQPTNFHTFGAGLFRGARPSAENLQYLKSIGVKNVISLQGEDINDPVFGGIAAIREPGESKEWIQYEKSVTEKLGMSFTNLPLSSLGQVTPDQARGIGRLETFINDPKNQPVYIHCEFGKDRTGLIVALYRVLYQGWAPEKAHEEMEDLGHGFTSQIFTSGMDDFFWAVVNDRGNPSRATTEAKR